MTRRQAVAAKVEEILNQSAFAFQSYLPKGWVKRAKIRWVRGYTAAQFRNGEIVLRVRAEKSADYNLMQSLFAYFSSALFPESRDILPENIVLAIALAITRASIEANHRYLLVEFDTVFLHSVDVTKQDVRDLFADCVRLNEYGFLMGPFIREVDRLAKEARFNVMRAEIPAMVQHILNHMLAFQPLLVVPEESWSYSGPCTSYGFILISRPPNTRPSIEAYVKRAQFQIQKGIKHIYLVGRFEERDFVSSVIGSLLKIRELKGIEYFALFRDYRGDPNGLGALLSLDERLAKLNLTQRPLDRTDAPSSSAKSDHVGELATESQQLDGVDQTDLSKIAEDLIVQLSDYEGAWISLAEFGYQLRKQVPGFTPQRYGGRNLISVLRQLNSLEFDVRGAGPAKSVYVRMRSVEQNNSEHEPSQEPTPDSEPSLETDAFTRILEILKGSDHVEGWMFLGQLGHLLKQQLPSFDCHQFGASSLSQFLHRFPKLEFEERGEWPNKVTYVRVKQ